MKKIVRFLIFCLAVVSLLLLQTVCIAQDTLSVTPVAIAAGAAGINAYDLIAMENSARSANGLKPLKVDENIMKCAQSTAEIMAAYNMSWHIGNVRDRISSFGYNNYYQSWATENFMMGGSETTLANIRESWGDHPHMAAAENPLYCHIGAGVAEASDGTIYFVLQAAYPAYKPGCGYVDPKVAEANNLKKIPKSSGGVFDGSNLIIAVQTATPDEQGTVYHVIRQGQALWHIANAYGTDIEALAEWNHMKTTDMLQVGEKLQIPPKGAVVIAPTQQLTQLATISADGKFRHTVQSGENLWSIAQLWKVDLRTLLAVNGLTETSTISIGWKLFVPVTPTVSPIPTSTQLPSATTIPVLTVTPAAVALTTVPDKRNPSPIVRNRVRWLKIILFALIGLIVGLMVILRKSR